MTEQSVNQTESLMMESAGAAGLKRRYGDAYRVAKATVNFGNGIKIAGIVLAALILLGTLMGTLIAVSQSDSMIGGALLIPGILLAGFVGLLFYLLGVLVAAQGQTLLASLDSAVNSSPFLTNDQKAEIMSLTS